MSKMSARFVGNKVGMSTDSVYNMWKDMGIVFKNTLGCWEITEPGRRIGGRMSKSNYCPVPTFDFEVIEKMMICYYNKNKKI